MAEYSLNKKRYKAGLAILVVTLAMGGLLITPHSSYAEDNRLPAINSNGNINTSLRENSHQLSEQELNKFFENAVKSDLAGNPSLARKGYDYLADTQIAPLIAVPSSVNYVALDNFDAAKKAFSPLMFSSNVKEADYARLWDLWLTARTWTKGKTALEKALSQKVSEYRWHTGYGQAIADLYAGKINTETLFNTIENTPDISTEIKLDAQTEAAFFAVGYFQYVKNDIPKAREVFQRSYSKLNDISLERPLINREVEKFSKLN